MEWSQFNYTEKIIGRHYTRIYRSAVCRDMCNWAPDIGCDLRVLPMTYPFFVGWARTCTVSSSQQSSTGQDLVCSCSLLSHHYILLLLNYLVIGTATKKYRKITFFFCLSEFRGCRPQFFWQMASPLPLLKLQTFSAAGEQAPSEGVLLLFLHCIVLYKTTNYICVWSTKSLSVAEPELFKLKYRIQVLVVEFIYPHLIFLDTELGLK